MAPTLYYIHGGAPSRVVLFTIRYLNLDVELHPVDMAKQEHLSPELLKINPSHSIPFLKDGNFVIFESRAIAQYLVESQKPESDILGRFAKRRALINQFLQFDLGKLLPALTDLYFPIMFGQATAVSDASKKRFVDVVSMLNECMKDGHWVAGGEVSLADLSLLATLSSAVALGFDLNDYENVREWYKRGKLLPGWDFNEEGATFFAIFVNSLMKGEPVF